MFKQNQECCLNKTLTLNFRAELKNELRYELEKTTAGQRLDWNLEKVRVPLRVDGDWAAYKEEGLGF